MVSPTYKPAWHLRGRPYSVQLEALRRCRDKDGYGWWLEQGLGKTALALNDYMENWADSIDTIIVLCPNSFKSDWALAPEEWGIGDLKTGYWPRDEIRPGRLNVMNFEAARGSGHKVIADLMDKNPVHFIVDESSAIKNFKSLTAKSVLDLSKRAHSVRLLNGTPMVQNVMDLFPQLKCLGELDGVNPYAFRNRYAVLGGWMGKQVVGLRNEEELHKILERCSFRALKRDWADLPDKIHVPVHLEMTNKQRKYYKEMLDDFFTLVEGHEFTANMVLGQMDKLRQISSGLLLDGDKCTFIEEPKNNPKIQAALELMDAGAGKTIIVHFYTKIGQAIYDEMKRRKLNPAYLRGRMTPDEVIEQKKMFNTNPQCRILVAQISAASLSHTLIGEEGKNRAHKMIFHDQTFSLKDRLQMEDRIHRGKQDRGCLYYDLVMSPIDEAQLKALSKKQDMASAVVDAVRALRTGSPSREKRV